MTAVEVDFHRSKQNRQMVIQQSCRIPEVRVYPPDSTDGNVINDGQCVSSTTQCHRHSEQWKPEEINDAKTKRFSHSTSDDQLFGDWNPFNLRPANITTFTSCHNTYRNSGRTHSVVIQRARSGWVSSAAKTLDLVRQNLQQHINKEIGEIIKQYTDKFFTPAIENIKRNNGDNSVSEEHVHAVYRQILEDAKRMYNGVYARGGTPLGDNSDSETGSHGESRTNCKPNISRKRKYSDTDSEASQYTWTTVRKKGRPPLAISGSSGRVTPSKQAKVVDVARKEGPKWDSSRITSDTRFIMGAKANKALGFGATRGRLYLKHPEVFKYCGDSEDKQWLYENNRMPATGGKAYMLILDDIKELVDSVEYRNSPALVLDALIGFQVPLNMMEKIRSSMNSQRTDINQKKVRGRPPNSIVESRLLNIPEPESFGSKAESGVDDDEKNTTSKSSHFEIPETGLLFVEGHTHSSLNPFDPPSTAIESDFPENIDVKPSQEPIFQSSNS